MVFHVKMLLKMFVVELIEVVPESGHGARVRAELIFLSAYELKFWIGIMRNTCSSRLRRWWERVSFRLSRLVTHVQTWYQLTTETAC